MRFNLLVSSLFCLLAAAGPISPRCDHDDNLTVETDLFTVKGAISPNSSLVRVFKGVPYAEPPVGSLRFRPPVTKKPESGIIDATSPFPICLQWGNVAPSVYTEYVTGDEPYPNATQSEDCLYLNIWTPLNATSKSNLAVMIWIHGGG